MASVQSPQALAKKVGPLPVWAWAALILVGYFAYNKLHKSSTVPTDQTPPADPGTYVPPYDQTTSGSPPGNLYGTGPLPATPVTTGRTPGSNPGENNPGGGTGTTHPPVGVTPPPSHQGPPGPIGPLG